MLQTKRRKFQRFEGPLFIEFRPLAGTASYSLGLTRNFSWEGFSFEFQGFSMDPGENLEFRLKQPRSNFIVSFLGNVIWKQQNDINCLAGIKFQKLDIKIKEKMLKMISDSFNIPAESWHPGNNKKILRIKKASENNISQLDEAAETGTVPEVAGKGRIKKVIFKMLFITSTVIMLFFIPRMIENIEEGSSMPASDFINSITYPGADKSNMEQEKAVDLKVPMNITDITETPGYYVQFASFEDPEKAYDAFIKITEYYPEAYLFRQNNLYKIRIPDITAHAQGVALQKDIEEKFNIKSILVRKTQ